MNSGAQKPNLSETAAALKRARELALDVRHYIRRESAGGQMSPVDRMLMARIEMFLESELPAAIKKDLGI